MKLFIVSSIIISCLFFVSCSKTEQVVQQVAEVETEIIPSQAFLTESYCDEGEDEDPQPMLSGNVYDTAGMAIYHACVEIQTTLGVRVAIIGTDINGHYYFNSVSNGSYLLVASASGYITKTTPITVSGTPQSVNVTLNP